MESRSRGVLDTRWSLSSGSPRARPGGGYDGRSAHASEHAIADREGVMEVGAPCFALVRRSHSIGQMPRPELIGGTWACREPQLELVLRLTRQSQNHEALGGPIIQYDRPFEDAAANVTRGQRDLQLGELLIS